MWITMLGLGREMRGPGRQRVLRQNASGGIGRLCLDRAQKPGVTEQADQAEHPQSRAGLAESLAAADSMDGIAVHCVVLRAGRWQMAE